MKKQMYTATLLSAAFLLAACDGSDGVNGRDGADGLDGEDGFNSLVAIRDIPKGDAFCLGGGTAVDSGLDTNRNDILDPEEVTSTTITECEATPEIRALHASPDAPAVNIWVDGSPALTDVDYAVGSGFVGVGEEVNVQVEAIIPGGNLVVIDEDLALDYNTETTIIAIDEVAGPLRPLAIQNASDERITEGYFRAQVVHAAPSAPPVDVYVTALGADLGASSPVNGAGTPIAFASFTDRLEVPAGNYQVRITLDGDASFSRLRYGRDTAAVPRTGADLMVVAVGKHRPRRRSRQTNRTRRGRRRHDL